MKKNKTSKENWEKVGKIIKVERARHSCDDHEYVTREVTDPEMIKKLGPIKEKAFAAFMEFRGDKVIKCVAKENGVYDVTIKMEPGSSSSWLLDDKGEIELEILANGKMNVIEFREAPRKKAKRAKAS